MVRRLTLGRVAGVYGVKGWVKLRSFTRPIDNLLDFRGLWIAKGEGYAGRLAEGKLHGDGIVARLLLPPSLLADGKAGPTGDSRNGAARLAQPCARPRAPFRVM